MVHVKPFFEGIAEEIESVLKNSEIYLYMLVFQTTWMLGAMSIIHFIERTVLSVYG